MSRALDVVCLGRAAVDLYAEQLGAPLEEAQTFAKYLGGSSGNVAVGLARLGLKVSMLTRVGDEHMGRFVRATLAAEGVDVSQVKTDPKRLTGLVLLGIESPERFPHIFYRENCADMGLEADDVSETHIASSRALAITGTHLSQPGARAAVRRAIELARSAGTRVVLDIDYRPVLWGLVGHAQGESRFLAAAQVTHELQGVLAHCDLVVGTEEEIRIAGGGESLHAALTSIRARTPAPIVMKRGAAGCTVFEGPVPSDLAQGLQIGGSRVEVMNLLGAGDAFLSGFLYGWLSGESWQRCGALGNAAGALVVTRHGCTPAMPTRAELEDFMARTPPPAIPDRDVRIAQLHRAAHVRRETRELCVLAFDHRRQLEQMAFAAGVPLARLQRLKEIIAEAVVLVGGRGSGPHRLGAIVDDRYGSSALAHLGHAGWWIGRPVEIPASRPLEFELGDNVGLGLVAWPRHHVVKVLVNYHPADPIDLRLEQERRVRALHEACAKLERELLIEVIVAGPQRAVTAHTAADTLRRFYNLGIRPAWWKLESQSSESWSEIAAVIAESDPLCQGVVLLGLDASEQALAESFAAAAPFPICRGFAVGRTIFGQPSREWLAGTLDDAQARERIAAAYSRVIDLWRAVRREPRQRSA